MRVDQSSLIRARTVFVLASGALDHPEPELVVVVAIDLLASLDEPSARVRADPPHDECGRSERDAELLGLSPRQSGCGERLLGPRHRGAEARLQQVVEGAGQIGVEELGEQPCRDVDGLEAHRETRISRDRGAAGEAALHVVSRGYPR